MNALADGKIPPMDWKGKKHPQVGRRLLRGKRVVMIQVRGDWEFYTSVFKFPRWDPAEEMCWASKTGI